MRTQILTEAILTALLISFCCDASPKERLFVTFDKKACDSRIAIALKSPNSNDSLKHIRLEIYARHGRAFKSNEFISYFQSTGWYKPNLSFSDTLLSELEKTEIRIIRRLEDSISQSNKNLLLSESIDGTWMDNEFFTTLRNTKNPRKTFSVTSVPLLVATQDEEGIVFTVCNNFHQGWPILVQNISRIDSNTWSLKIKDKVVSSVTVKRESSGPSMLVSLFSSNSSTKMLPIRTFSRYAKPFQRLLDSVVIVGDYTDEKGAIVSFRNDGEIKWKKGMGRFEVCYDYIEDYGVSTFVVYPEDTTKEMENYGFKWNSSDLELFLINTEEHKTGKHLALLTPKTKDGHAEVLSVQKIKKNNLPSNLKFTGDFIDGASWEDKETSHFLIISGSKSGELFKPGWRSDLSARKYTKEAAGMKMNWEIKDSSSDNFSEVKYIPGTLQIMDINKDGISEIRFLIEITHGGDPVEVKYALSFHDRTCFIQGSVPIGFDDSTDCETTIGSSFGSLPSKISSFAKKDWDSLMTNIFSCFVKKKANRINR